MNKAFELTMKNYLTEIFNIFTLNHIIKPKLLII